MSRQPEAGQRTRRPEDRAPEIARAALDLFVAKGFAATKLEDVAKAAGVSKGLPYLYFKSKEDLFKAVIVEAIGQPLARANEMVDGFDGPTDLLLRHLVAKFREFAESPLGGVIKLAGVNGRLSDLLVITKLVNVFECFDDAGAAVASFEPVLVAAAR